MTDGNARRTLLIIACLLIAIPVGVAEFVQYSTRPLYSHESALPPVEGLEALPAIATLEELAEFETHLPIVVVEFSREPEIHTSWDSERGYSVRFLEEPYVEGRFFLYNKGSKPNRLTDAPALTTRIIARLRGFSSMKFPKHQYLIRMLAEDGGRNEVDVLGMGAEWEWILNISYIDKSLIRNYLCMNIAARAMGYAPEMRYCEVFQKRGGQYEYLGLYLLMESIKRGPNRVAISKYDPSYAETAYILRRDRYDDRGIILDTYGSIHNLAEEFLGVRYPGRNTITDKTVAFIERDISRFEKALYSNEVKEFIGYRDQIDIDSFVDYYVINEFFGSYDSGFHSYYMHKDLRERLKLGPLWDFDQAIDNNRPYVFEPEAAAMQTGVWFDRLVMDGLFSRRIRSRYRQLRRSILSDRYIGAFIDEAVAYMGDARIRDWNRWQYDNQEVLQRDKIEQVHPSLASNSRNFEEEIEHIRIILQQHGAWLDKHLGDVVMGNVITD